MRSAPVAAAQLKGVGSGVGGGVGPGVLVGRGVGDAVGGMVGGRVGGRVGLIEGEPEGIRLGVGKTKGVGDGDRVGEGEGGTKVTKGVAVGVGRMAMPVGRGCGRPRNTIAKAPPATTRPASRTTMSASRPCPIPNPPDCWRWR
jgi:hypothetical protein